MTDDEKELLKYYRAMKDFSKEATLRFARVFSQRDNGTYQYQFNTRDTLDKE